MKDINERLLLKENMQLMFFLCVAASRNISMFFNLNKAWLFEGSFSGLGVGGLGVSQFELPSSYFKKNLSNINITLYNY